MNTLKHLKKNGLFLFIFSLLFALNTMAQRKKNVSYFNQKDFERNKISENTYHLWWSKYPWGPLVRDTIPYFVDDRKYQGIINYGVTFKSTDFKVFTFSESKAMYFLDVTFTSCTLRSQDSIIEIEGFVNGGWGDKAKDEDDSPKNYIEIFVGEKIDTISACYFNISVNKEKVTTKRNNKNIEPKHILDTFPSFYFKNPAYFRTASRGNRFFKIKARVNKNTILVVGGSGCYSEIFDIGNMVFMPQKNHRNKIKKKNSVEFEHIIIDNLLVSEREKENQNINDINYYTYTEKAETHILKRQYAFAKESYLILDKEYKILFARDIHNAIRCAILSRDYKSAFYFGKKLASKGVEKNYFNAKIFFLLKNRAEWNQFSADYDSLFKESQSRKNMLLKEQIERLVQEDQVDYGLQNRKDPKKLYETTQRVTAKLADLLINNGFPSEEKIGVYTKNDTVLISSPEYNVLIRHAVQQNPLNLSTLSEILDKSNDSLEYDKKRSPNHREFLNSCFQVYKGNLYSNKSCGTNDLMVRKIKFMFSNPYNFIIDQGDYIIAEYNKENPEEYDKYYKENFNLIMKLTDDWQFYEN